MSKSEESPMGTVLLLDTPELVTKKVKSAVTDSGREVRYDPDEKPGVSNLIELFAAVTKASIPDVEAEFAEANYGTFKKRVAEAIVECLRPLQTRYRELEADPAELDRLLARGAQKARGIAAGVLEQVREATGLLAVPRP
jgi:tryptophanyl-tRNA synthetase